MASSCQPREITKNMALLGLLTLASIVYSSQLSSDEIGTSFTKHMTVINKFPCNLPQPRSIFVKELLENQIETSETIQPHVTVLHRCDNGTGCCPDEGTECKMVEFMDVGLQFFVSDSIRKHKAQFREFRFQNHTKCLCQSRRNPIK